MERKTEQQKLWENKILRPDDVSNISCASHATGNEQVMALKLSAADVLLGQDTFGSLSWLT